MPDRQYECLFCGGDHRSLDCPQLQRRMREVAIAHYRRILRREQRRMREIFDLDDDEED